MKTYKCIVTWPKEYLKDGPEVEIINITEDEIEDIREDGESDEDVIEYMAESAVKGLIASWE